MKIAKSLFFLLLMIGGLMGCANQSFATPVVTLSVTPTYILADVPTLIPTTTLTITDTPVLAGPEQISLSAQDPFYLSMIANGYKLAASGSIIGPQGYTYSAYLFFNCDLSPSRCGAEKADKDALQVAFYRWDGKQNALLSVQNLPPYHDEYATDAGLINWDQPQAIWHYTGIEAYAEPEPETVKLLNQTHYSSDINQNGLPEFAFITEYCTTSCHAPEDGVHLFEVENIFTVKNITQNLPGLTSFGYHTVSPFTFYVHDALWFDVNRPMGTYWVYALGPDGFVDVSQTYADEYLKLANENIRELKAQYGHPFDANYRTMGIYSLQILQLYEKAGMPEKGLQIFLEITDLSHWPGTEPLSQCWLQVNRAYQQESLQKKNHLALLPAIGVDINRGFADELKQAGYDISACDSSKK